MTYELQIEETSTIQRKLKFTVPSDVVGAELDLAYRALRPQVRLPGFRPGKVPRQMIEQRFGRRVKADVGAKLIDESYKKAAASLEVASQPALEERGEVDRGNAFTFTIAVEVKPAIVVKDYNGVAVSYPVATVNDNAVEAAIQQRLVSQARIDEVTEDREVKEGDLVLTELVLTADDGTELVNEAGTMIHTTAERYYPGVEELLIGLKKGKKKSKKVTIGEGSLLENLKGVSAKASVKVIGIQAHVVPELSDDLAKELGYDSAEAMRTRIRDSLTKRADDAGQMQARANLLQVLVDKHSFDVPSGMVDEQLDGLKEEMKIRRIYAGENPNNIRFGEAELADLRTRAVFAAKSACILAAIAKQEGLVVSDADRDARIDEIAAARGQAREAIRGYLQRENALGVLDVRILEEKTLDWLIERANLTAQGSEPKAAPKKAAPKKAAPKKGEDEAAASATVEAPAEEAPAEKKAKKPAAKKAAKKDEAEVEAAAPAEEKAAKKPAAKKPAAKKAAKKDE